MRRRRHWWKRMWLPVVLHTALLAGCGSSAVSGDHSGELVDLLVAPISSVAESDDAATIRLWTFYQANEFEFLESLAEQYHALYPDVKIKVEFVQIDDYFSTRLLSAFTSGQGPDVFFVSPGNIDKFVKANILQPLTQRFTPEIRDDFYHSALDAVTIDDEIYAVPFEVELIGLYYNTQMFQSKGLQPPRTWQDMREAAEALHTKQASGLTMETNESVYQNFTWLPFLWHTGADLIDSHTGKSGLDDPRALQMFNFFREMRESGLLNLNPSRPTNDIGIIANGETVMQVAGTWNIRALETTYAEVPIDVVPLPTPNGEDPISIAGGWKIAVNKHSDNLDKAVDFVMWAYAEDVENPLKWCSEIKFAYSPRKSVMDAGDDYYKKGMRATFTNELFGHERPEPRLSGDVSRIFSAMLRHILYSDLDAEEVLKEVHEQLNSALSAN